MNGSSLGAASHVEAGAPQVPRRHHALGLLAALVVVGAVVGWVHSPVLRAEAYCFDDAQFVRANPLVTHPSWSSAARFFREVTLPSTVKGYYLPLSMTSLMLDFAAGRSTDELWEFHRTNLVLHVLCTLLIVVLLFRLFGSILAAAICGLLFGLHPLTVEPIAWIGERKTLLAAFFALASIVGYLEFVRSRSRGWRVASLLLFLLALLSKPTVVPLPVLLILIDVWPLRRGSWRSVVEKWPWLLLALSSAVITIVSHQRSSGLTPLNSHDILLWPLRSSYLIAFYVMKLVRPTDLTPAYMPPHNFALANPTIALMVAGVVGLTVALVLARCRAPGLSTGWLFFLVSLGPTLGLVQYTWVVASDKYVYVPVWGILMVLCSGLVAFLRRGHALRIAATLAIAVAVLAAEAQGVRAALRPWANTATLTRHMYRLAPNCPPVLNRMAIEHGTEGNLDRGIADLRLAIALAPRYPDVRFNLALLLGNAGRPHEAMEQLEIARALEPGDPEGACLMGVLQLRTGGRAEAEKSFRRAVELDPDMLEALKQLGGLLVVEGRVHEATPYLRRAVALAPNMPDGQYRLAAALVMSGHSSEAVEPLRVAIRLKPDWTEALNALAWLRATDPDPSVRDTAEALRLAESAARLTNRQDPKVMDTLAAAQAAAQRFDEALATSAQAIDLAYERHTPDLAAQLERRRGLYKAHTPYIETAGAREPQVP